MLRGITTARIKEAFKNDLGGSSIDLTFVLDQGTVTTMVLENLGLSLD